MNIIACPQCNRQYQVKGDPTGKTVKCANCQHVFTVAGTVAAAPAKAAAQTETATTQSTTQSKLFPESIPGGPDPLANHIVQDPGFANVDIDEIRRVRELAARKKNKLADAYTASSSLGKMEDEQAEKSRNRIPNEGLLDKDTLFGFEGRINRQKWWLSAILAGLIGAFIFSVASGGYFMILFILDVKLPSDPEQAFGSAIGVMIPFLIMYGVYFFVMTWISVALHVKRYHDLGKPGWWFLLALIPIVGIWVFIECGFFRGNTGKNAYGDDPLSFIQ